MAAPSQIADVNKTDSSTIATKDTKEDKIWQDLRLSEKLCAIMKIDSKVDCKFVVGPEIESAETIFGHKWMFAIESPAFERMFCGDFIEAKEGVTIRLPDDDPSAFRNLRRLLYNARPCEFEILSFEDTLQLYKICDKYIIKSISKLCVDNLKNRLDNLTVSQLITLFGFANELPNLNLLEDVKEELQKYGYPLVPDLNNLKVVEFEEYVQSKLEHHQGLHDNLELFNAIEEYVTHHQLTPQNLLKDDKTSKSTLCEDYHVEEIKNSTLERLLSYVDFGLISIDDFLAGPGVSKILTWQQKYFIVSQLATLPCEDCEEPQELTIKLFSQN